jgi:hypothetical protein
MILKRDNQTSQTKTYPSATLSTTNLTWTDQSMNMGFQSERPATNCLNHGMVKHSENTYPPNWSMPFILVVFKWITWSQQRVSWFLTTNIKHLYIKSKNGMCEILSMTWPLIHFNIKLTYMLCLSSVTRKYMTEIWHEDYKVMNLMLNCACKNHKNKWNHTSL